jgi:hypothetical protein
MFVGEVSARLGVDSSGIASDMTKANAAFAQGAAAGGESSGAAFGDKFSSRLRERLLGRGALSNLFVGFGLDPKGIADTIAGAIVGGSAQGWEQAASEADKYEQLIKEHFKLTSTKGEQETALKKQIAEAEAEAAAIKPTTWSNLKALLGRVFTTGNLGDTREGHMGGLNASQLKAQQAALAKREAAENELLQLQKEDTKAQEEFNQAQIETLAPQAKIAAIEKERYEIWQKLQKGSQGANPLLALSEQLELKKKILEIDKQVAEENTKVNKANKASDAEVDAEIARLNSIGGESIDGNRRGSSHSMRGAIQSGGRGDNPDFRLLHETVKKSNDHLGRISKAIEGKFVNQ